MKHVMGILISVVLVAGCDNEDNVNSDEKANMTFKGSDFMSVSAGKSMSFIASGTSTNYDSLGIVTSSFTASNEELKMTIGTGEIIQSVLAYPLNQVKENSLETIAYLAINNASVLGYDGSSEGQPVILLPSEFKIGKEWIANPQRSSDEQVKLKLVDYLSSYTAKSGTKFSDVLKIELTHTGKSEYTYFYSWSLNNFYSDTTTFTQKVSGFIYYAKNGGLVEAVLTNLDVQSRNVNIYRNGNYYERDVDYNHSVGSGSLSLKY
ncbi:MAG: hypothetical protein J0L62_13610 [Bacteroidetes bacterium]|nr:hypothetical protein [Bacteroidota bacterium]